MNKKTKKIAVVPEDINSNILSSVVLRADLAGIVDITPYIELIKYELDDFGLILSEDILKEEDILLDKNYEVMSSDINIMKNVLGKAPVFRFSKNEGKILISISRYFINIQLDYSIPHTLKRYIELIDKLINKLYTIKYVRIERLSLRKINYIVCSTINNLLKCFDKKLWNDISIELKAKNKNETIKLFFSECNNNFAWNEFIFNVNKNIEEGILSNNTNKTVFKGTLDIDSYIYIDSNNSILDSKTYFESMNEKIFEIFKTHMTISFLNDLIIGDDKKVMMGVKLNGNKIHIPKTIKS